MGFLTGRLAFTRFRVVGRSLRMFGPDQLEKLSAHVIGAQRIAASDGSTHGWIAADHILDTRFDLAKNIIGDCLHFALRVDSQAIPGELLRAYTQVELEALAESNPSGMPSARQKREARLRAKEQLEQEASDGRFLRRKSFPLLWDALTGELLVGTTSITAFERVIPLFKETFDRRLEFLGAGSQAFAQAEANNQTRAVDDASPSAFISGWQGEPAWLPDETSRDFLGNEFLLWLWYVVDSEGDVLTLPDESDVTIMFTKSLVLECPRGETGRETIQSEGPTRLPEARRAIQAGKMPRKAGLTIARHDNVYELTLHAESLALTGARLPPTEEEDDRARLEARVGQIRELIETLDLMYQSFGEQRFSPDWSKNLTEMRKWLQQG